MYKLIELHVECFRSIALTTLRREHISGLVLVRGENHDVPSASSNMAGKTTLANALTWCTHECDVSGESIAASAIMHGAPDCRVRMSLIDEDTSECVSIERKRVRRPKGGQPVTTLRVAMRDSASNTQETVREGPAAQVQEAVDAVLGSKRMFLAAHVFGYGEKALPFAAQPESAKRGLFEELVGVDDLLRAKQRADESRERLRRRAELFTEREQARRRAIAQLQHVGQDATRDLDTELREARDKRAQHESRRDKASLVEHRLASILSSAACDESDRVSEVDALRDTLDRMRNDRDVELRLRDNELRHIAERYKLLRDASASRCPTCTAPLTVTLRARLSQQLDEDKSRLRKLRDERENYWIEACKAKRRELLDAQRALTIARRRTARERAQHDKACASLREAETSIARSNEHVRRIESLKSQHDARVAQRLKSARDGLRALLRKAARLRDTLEDVEYWRDAFGPKGIYAYRLAQITPLMNAIAKRYSDRLFGDGQRVHYTTQVESKSGELRESFACQLIDADDAPVEVRSGGQNTRRDIVHTLTMIDVAQRHKKRTLDLVILDEVFRTVDTEGTSAVISLLESLSERIGSIWVIEHNEDLEARFVKGVCVSKKKGVSHVSCHR